jgi:osmotically-inducible protein OsmY
VRSPPHASGARAPARAPVVRCEARGDARITPAKRAYDDVTLTRKVESELFRGTDVPAGAVNVNVKNGVLVLRGQLERPEDIEELERKARRIPGVAEVENLLHVAGTPAPMS